MSTETVGANISSNILFHFTPTMENLLNILGKGFSPRYCPEYMPGDHSPGEHKSPEYAKAMMCFCDLPLSLIKRQLIEYGQFGIGLDKKWGFSNYVSPVLYYEENSLTFRSIMNLGSIAFDRELKPKSKDTPILDEVFHLLAFTKAYRGSAWRFGKYKEEVTFYDEREWRYVPRGADSTQVMMPRVAYENVGLKEREELKLAKDHTLPVTPDDIQYLLLPDDSYLDPMIDELERRYLRKEVRILTTCILTCDRILADI